MCTIQWYIDYFDIAGSSSARGALNNGGAGKTSCFGGKCVNISKTAGDLFKVTIND